MRNEARPPFPSPSSCRCLLYDAWGLCPSFLSLIVPLRGGFPPSCESLELFTRSSYTRKSFLFFFQILQQETTLQLFLLKERPQWTRVDLLSRLNGDNYFCLCLYCDPWIRKDAHTRLRRNFSIISKPHNIEDESPQWICTKQRQRTG